jgi:hypothetical protein
MLCSDSSARTTFHCAGVTRVDVHLCHTSAKTVLDAVNPGRGAVIHSHNLFCLSAD